MVDQNEISIPGVVYKTRLRRTSEGWNLDILLRGAVETSVLLKTANEAGVKAAFTRAIQKVDITHQVPTPVLNNISAGLARFIESNAEITDDSQGEVTESELGSEISQVEEKLTKLLSRLEEIELRLERIEGRLGV